jgi:hypothetical protein
LRGSKPETGNDAATNVKPLKVVIVLSAVVGLLEIVLPVGGESLIKQLYELSVLEAVVYAAIFVLPLVMAVAALVRPPMLPWQAGVALAGFVLGVVRFRVWEMLPHLGADVHGALRLAAIVVGTIASIVALMKPEAPV